MTNGDIRGLLHCHTDFSDGGNTLEEMAEATRDRGYQYFGVADHSQSAGYAGGLKVEDLEAQLADADALNARYGGRFRIFKGIELTSCRTALSTTPTTCWNASISSWRVHGRFVSTGRHKLDATLRAVANPYTTILGHMTGLYASAQGVRRCSDKKFL